MLQFQGYQIENIEFVNVEEKQEQIELGINNEHTVSYNHNEHVCISTDIVEIADKDAPDKFKLRVIIHGRFGFEAGDDQKEMHVDTYNDMFPFVRQAVASIMMTCGMQPLYIQPVKMTTDNVRVAEDLN